MSADGGSAPPGPVSPTGCPPSQPPGPPIEVAAALVFRRGRLLICLRPPGSHCAGLWEFPGGKREPGETWEACLMRELREELDVDAEIGALFQEIVFAYPTQTVQLRFYLARLRGGNPAPMGCADLRWVDRADLRAHAFPAADTALLDRLLAAADLWVDSQTGDLSARGDPA